MTTDCRQCVRLVSLFCIVLALSSIANAAMQTPIAENSILAFRAPLRVGAHVRIDHVPLADDILKTLDLEAFDVIAPDAVLAIYGESGSVKHVKFPATRYFRGRVTDDPTSMAVIGIRETGEVVGF